MPTRIFSRFVMLGAGAALVLPALLCPVGSANAAVVISGDTAPTSYDITGRARNGRTGFEGILLTPSSSPNMNPVGAPVWSYGSDYNFALNYNYATGAASWSIDFNRDGDFGDSQESVSVTTPALVGIGFNYVNLFIQGRTTPSSTVTVSNFTLNGTSFGPFSTGGAALNTLFEDTTGPFKTITGTGTFSFSANGNSDELPRLWVQLGDQVAIAAVPEPSTWAMMIVGFLGLGWLARRRLNKQALAAA